MGGHADTSRLVRLGTLVAIFIFALLGAVADASAGSGAIIGQSRREDVRLARFDKSRSGWVSLADTVGSEVGFGPNGIARFHSLPPGRYGIVEIRSSVMTHQAQIRQAGQGGSGAVYAYALIEFTVGPNEIVNAGYLQVYNVIPVPDALVQQLATSVPGPSRVVKRLMAITH